MANTAFFRLGEHDTDSVFMRSFSSLIIACLLRKQCDTPFLSLERLRHYQADFLHYFNAEKDYRGFVSEKGWAHAVAHGVDVLGEFARLEALGADDLEPILATIQYLPSQGSSVYSCDEDERLGYAARQLFECIELTDAVLLGWLERFAAEVRHCSSYASEEAYRRFVNIKHFLRALYFELKCHWKRADSQTVAMIERLLELCRSLQMRESET